MPYDPSIYDGAAAHYARGRPPYSAELVPTLVAELGLDGSGRLLDVGCGPGVLTLELAACFTEAVGLATFGQSFQWTHREQVAESVYDVLEPGGAIVLVAPTVDGRPVPEGPGHVAIPHDAIRQIIRRYLGERSRAGKGFRTSPQDRYEDALARTRFGSPEVIFAPGRPDVVRDVDGVLDNYHSMSYCAPHLFGDQLDAFDRDVRAELATHASDGLFWDWPGDTEILIARKPKEAPGR